MAITVLEARQITKQFGGLTAVSDVDFALEEGAIGSIIGPNGAGKTTFFNMVSGLYHPTKGHLIFQGRDLGRLRPNRIAHLGIGRSFQITNIFLTY